MKTFERRPLTAGEIALGRGVFGDAIAWDKVRVAQAPPLGAYAMAPFGRTIFYARWRAWRDFTRAPLQEQGVFIHELAHVWQAGRGVTLAYAKLGALGKSAYRIPREAPLKAMNIEQQAEVARALFLARAKGAPDPHWEKVWREGAEALTPPGARPK